jgi:putative transposase
VKLRLVKTKPFVVTTSNQVWAYDFVFDGFVFDGCVNGDKLKCLTMTDEFTKETIRIDVADSIRSKCLI